MSQAFASVSMSLDGFIAGPHRGPANPLGDGGVQLHEWVFRQRAWRQAHGLGSSGDTGADNQLVEEIIERHAVQDRNHHVYAEQGARRQQRREDHH